MDLVQKILIYLTFIICCLCLILLSVSLSTEKWLESKPVMKREGVKPTEDGRFQGDIYFGLFYGKKNLNYGFGDRLSDVTIKSVLKEDPPIMIYGLWLFTVLSIALSILFGLVGAVFAVINSVTTPIELITGILGLYLWNGMGALFSLGAIVSWVLQYYLKLKENVMSKEEINSDWSSKDKSTFGYSFVLVIVTLILYIINIIIVTVIIKQPWKIKMPKMETQKNPEGVIMLY